MNWYGIKAIYIHEMERFRRTLFQSLASPIITTSLYFVVFGSAIGSRITEIDGINYGSYIVPGMIMLTILTQSISNASFAFYFPRFTNTIYEILAAPLSSFEIVLGFVGAAASKSLIIGCVIILTANFFVDVRIDHPLLMMFFLILTSITFALFGFIIGMYAEGFEGLQIIPILIITPLVFLGGSFYSINMLPEFWQMITYFNPVVYLINGLRYSFYGISDFNIWISVGLMVLFFVICVFSVSILLKKGYNIKS